jgi:hypothetical protein
MTRPEESEVASGTASESDTERARLWEQYRSLAEGERHFNEIENGYRLLTSTWLLAYLGAAGYLLTHAESESVFAPEVLVALLGVVCAAGVSLLWNIDLRVYHRLLDAFFVEGLQMEMRYEWLPQIRLKMVFSQYDTYEIAKPDGGVMRRIKLFYIFSTSFCLLIATAVGFFYMYRQDHFAPASAIAVSGVVLAAVWGRYKWVKTTSPALGAWIKKEKPRALERLARMYG